MSKKSYFTKIAKEEGTTFKGKPILLSENNYGQVYCCDSSMGKLIIKIGLKEGVVEKIPGLGKKRLLNEFLFSSFLAENKVTPKIIKFNQSNKLILHPYIIYKKITGDSLAMLTEKNKISQKCMETIYKNMGKELKLIHKIKFKKFGNLANLTKTNKQFKGANWHEFLSSVLDQCLDKIKGGYFGGNFFILKEYVKKNMLLMKDIKITPTLLHGDFEPWNIIVRNNRVAGIIDGEFAFSGHNLMDLVPEYPSALSKSRKQILKQHFLKGYFGENNPSVWDVKCMDFYQDIKIITHRMVVWDFFVKTVSKKEKVKEEKKIKKVLEEISVKLKK